MITTFHHEAAEKVWQGLFHPEAAEPDPGDCQTKAEDVEQRQDA
jgi:hypothetical protein